MARAGERLTVARQALERLDQLAGLAAPSPVERDAAIQRFEFTVEAVWKAAQAFVDESHGLTPASPKAVIRACHDVGVLDAGEAREALQMIDDRNLTAHTYNEALAQIIFSRLAGYAALLRTWVDGMGTRP